MADVLTVFYQTKQQDEMLMVAYLECVGNRSILYVEGRVSFDVPVVQEREM